MTEPMPDPASTAGSAGALLRAAREKQGLHIAALAAAIKVPQRKLEALEGDRHDELPDATFTRALAQTVCRSLKIDAKPVLDLLPPVPSQPIAPGSGGLGTPFRDRPGRIVPGLSPSNVRPLVWAAAVLVLGALVVYLAPGAWWARLVPTGGVPADAASVTAPTPGLVTEPVSVPAPADGSASAAAPQAAVETVFSAPPPGAAASDPAVAMNGILQLRCAEETWVDVRDARGQLLLSRNVQPGESVGLDGDLPLRVVIGNAAATQLAFRGQPVNLAERTRDNVARLELP